MAMPIIPWIGGKRRLADVLIPRFPAHSCYVEVFAGAAALFFMRPPAAVEVLNDVNDELVNLYRVVQHHLEESHTDRHPACSALLLPPAELIRWPG
ncbi:site-specific DNA-adenine methylase [Paraburkholderia sp. CI2]|nr:site-specific DNA-adenine methylase [Paraburkholderia sp. CI2]